MKFLILSLICTLAASESSLYGVKLDEHWENFKRTFSKNYDGEEEINRLLIFKQNLAFILNHNLEADMGLHSYTLGINKFTDMTNDEFRARHRCRIIPRSERNMTLHIDDPNLKVARTVDWSTKGYVTPVKDQGNCGSCYAFSANGALEGQMKKKTGKLVGLSEQQIVDCSRPKTAIPGNNGCDGGWFTYSWEYIQNNKGINSDATYRYRAVEGKCKFDSKKVAGTCKGFASVPVRDEKALKRACASVGPIATAMDGSQPTFQHYKNGIYEDKKCRNDDPSLDHCILLVGYGSTGSGASKKKYWKIKLSYGASFGERGYIRIARNKNNMCGVATDAAYPIV